MSGTQSITRALYDKLSLEFELKLFNAFCVSRATEFYIGCVSVCWRFRYTEILRFLKASNVTQFTPKAVSFS